jgi:magnesium transporter
MKLLTVVSAVLLPLTVIAGIYGMNFEHMPELAKPWGYPVVLVAMATVGVGMLAWFKRKGWL